jgi:hypothetical protein
MVTHTNVNAATKTNTSTNTNTHTHKTFGLVVVRVVCTEQVKFFERGAVRELRQLVERSAVMVAVIITVTTAGRVRSIGLHYTFIHKVSHLILLLLMKMVCRDPSMLKPSNFSIWLYLQGGGRGGNGLDVGVLLRADFSAFLFFFVIFRAAIYCVRKACVKKAAAYKLGCMIVLYDTEGRVNDL